jgi:hypothetical protein
MDLQRSKSLVLSRALLALVLSPLVACVGEIGSGASDGDGDGPGSDPERETSVDCTQRQPGAAPMRRLTHVEYDNTVRDLLGDDSRPSTAFSKEEIVLGFDNSATQRTMSAELAEQYLLAAERLAERATSERLDEIAPCGSGESDVTCGRRFVADFARRAYRRPVSDAERDALMTTFDAGAEEGGYAEGIAYTLTRILQSASFLYRVELAGEPGPDEVIQLDGWEVASRLSYLFWQTMPDETLFAAAEADALSTKEAIAAQARRMIADPRARPAVLHFYEQWLQLDAIDRMVKNTDLYPAYSDALKPAMKEETRRFVEHLVWESNGTVADLLTAPYTFVDADLAGLYGVTPPSGDGFARVDLDPSQRAGILTQLGVLASNAKASQTSPIKRGLFVRQQLLCEPLPPPPPGADTPVPEPREGQTTRERFAAHTASPACAGCHTLIDPIGFGFEHYDAIGQYRTTDGGVVVDATGAVADEGIGAFEGAVELASKVAASPKYQACAATQWFRFASGREDTAEDVCTLDTLSGIVESEGTTLVDLLVGLTQTDAFMYRSTKDGESK